MKLIDVKNPEFRIVADHDIHVIERMLLKLSHEGWYPVGGVNKKDHDWVQVMVREKNE